MTQLQGVDRLSEIVTRRLGLSVQDVWASRLERIVAGLPVDRLEGMLSQLADLDLDAPLWQQIISGVTIGETRFLRQRSWFNQIERLAIAPLIKQRRQEANLRLRFWSAACSTGEEAYTLAILVSGLLPDIDRWQITILATDVRSDALQEARRAEYNRRQLRELDDHQIARYFTGQSQNALSVSDDIRRMVRFGTLNLADAAGRPFDESEGRFDLIICRNVLMYMIPDMQRKIANHLTAALGKDGWLAVSPAEASADWYRSLTPVNAPEAILFTKTPSTRPQPQTRRPDRHVPASSRRPVPPVTPLPPSAEAAKALDTSISELRALADRRMLAEARSGCADLLAADRLNCDASMLLAEICLELDDPSSACDAARKAIYLAPQSAMAHYLLAGALGRMGRTVRARNAMRTALELANAADAETPAATCSDITHQQIRNAASAFLNSGSRQTGRIMHDQRE
jgi:chemotaxis protein methyltransferase CheR